MKLFNFFKQEDAEIVAKIRAATQLRMDDAARERTRALLSEYVQMRPVRAQAASPSYASGPSGFFMRHSIPAFAAVLVVVIGGTAAAAEGALPGDILYSVKVHVNEEMRATLTVSPKAKADWEVVRAERRLEEAATLALSGKLDDATRAEINTNLDSNVKTAGENRKQLENDNETSEASEVETSIQAVLIARENILDGKHVAAAKAAARPEAAALMMSARAAPEADDQASDGEDAESKGHRTAAKARIEAAKKFLNRAPVRLSDDARAQIETNLKEAAEAFSSGEVEVSEGNKVEASSHFDSALESATKIEAIVSVSADTDDTGSTGDNRAGERPGDNSGSGSSGSGGSSTNIGL